MRLPLVLLGSVALLLVLALALIWVPLPAPVPEPGSQARQLPAAVATALLGLALMARVAWSEVAPVLGARRSVDVAMAAEGLTARRYLVVGRSYSGRRAGRAVEVLYVPAARGQPGLVEVRVAADVGFRAALGKSRPLLDCRDCPASSINLEGVGALRVASDAVEHIGAVAGSERGGAALSELLGTRSGAGGCELYLLPEKVWFRCHVEVGGETDVPRLLHAALELARAVEGVHSQETVQRR